MFKKTLSFVLVLLIGCCTLMLVLAQTEPSHVEENAVTDTASLSSETVTGGSVIAENSDYLFTASADPEYLEWLLGVPNEILCASTDALLEYFLESPFMGQQIYSLSSTFEEREIDFSCHEAFRELVSREDCVEALEHYAESILCDSKHDETDIAKFEKLLAQPLVRALLSDLPSIAESCPNLQSIYARSEDVTAG